METLRDTEDVSVLNAQSFHGWVVVFKHSTRCHISRMVLQRITGHLQEIEAVAKFYYLDLLANREISNEISQAYQVAHESPQVLVIKDGQCCFNASHGEITSHAILQTIATLHSN